MNYMEMLSTPTEKEPSENNFKSNSLPWSLLFVALVVLMSSEVPTGNCGTLEERIVGGRIPGPPPTIYVYDPSLHLMSTEAWRVFNWYISQRNSVTKPMRDN